MKQDWKQIKEYPLYEISNTGKIRRIDDGFHVPEWLALVRGGMIALLTTGDGQPVQKRVDRLVLEAFKPDEHGETITHKNNKIYDCTLDNLDYLKE